MSATGRKKATGAATVRDVRDFYRTPSWAVDAIVPHLPMGGMTLDAGCGDGAISKALFLAGWQFSELAGIEKDAALLAERPDVLRECRMTKGDFLKHEGRYNLVISNPPYGQAEAFVRHALRLVAPQRGTVAMLLRLAFLEGQGRVAFHREHPSDVYVLPKRPSFTGGGTDATAYAWLVWAPGRGNRWEILSCGKIYPGKAAE